ncbi:MAG: flagellar hook-basal body complex protein [Pseudomonadota bacterium]|nr:flagellar hook-basal body complex protein [Pseudomonadota bacterium]
MMQALYNSVSGLFGFSNSLNTIGDNISNMNTPGFRGSDSFFENVFGGDGTKISGTGKNLSEGNIQQTSTVTDAAIMGDGFYILKDSSGNTYYTRSGQFEFNASGQLVDSVNKYLVQGFDPSGNLGNFDISNYKSLPAQATTTVNMAGNIMPSDPSDAVNAVTVYDAQGNAHTLKITMTNNTAVTPGSWLVAVTDSSGNTLGSGEIRFDSTGTPQAGFNTLTVTGTLGGSPQSIVFNFGAANSTSGVTNFSGVASDLSAAAKDGHAVVGIASESFDINGTLQIVYSDGETKAGPQFALATFQDESSMQLIQGNLYARPQGQTAQVGRANTANFGKIEGSSLEMSNVDLTQELADMIVLQRGYQASSRVMTVSSAMLQQLYDSTRGA